MALVEFALVLPILLLVLFAIVDVGKAVSYWNDETHLAGEAARYAAVNKTPVAGQTIEQAIKNQAITSELKSGSGGSEGVQGTGVDIFICFPNYVGGGPPPVAGDPVKV
ncbi:MAG: pilus assembly protein, partial [Actinomycetota bacterium]|nr:pilus assembly protein [Actinomycetota bacterium]